MTRQERTGWRDESLSRRHREWGAEIHMTDIDFVAIEHLFGQPVAIVEFKRWGKDGLLGERVPDFSEINMKVLRNLADASGVPFLVAIYEPRPWRFRIYRGNDFGSDVFPLTVANFSERSFVENLYRLRGRPVNRELLRNLDNSPVIAPKLLRAAA